MRHAQPAWVKDGRGVLDPELTELGILQARKLAETWPKSAAPDLLWVSPAIRARQTAQPLADRFGVEPEVHDDLTEIRLPETFASAPAREVGKIISATKHRPPEAWWTGVDGAEAYRDFHQRVTSCLAGLLETIGLSRQGDRDDPRWAESRTLPETVVIVAHGGTNATLTADLLTMPPRPWIWESLLIQHTGAVRLKARRLMAARVFGLAGHGELPHLEREERSH